MKIASLFVLGLFLMPIASACIPGSPATLFFGGRNILDDQVSFYQLEGIKSDFDRLDADAFVITTPQAGVITVYLDYVQVDRIDATREDWTDDFVFRVPNGLKGYAIGELATYDGSRLSINYNDDEVAWFTTNYLPATEHQDCTTRNSPIDFTSRNFWILTSFIVISLISVIVWWKNREVK